MNLIPQPKKVKQMEGSFTLDAGTVFYFSPAFEAEKEQWKGYFAGHTNFTPAFGEEPAQVSFLQEEGLPEEGYVMEVSPSRMTVKASTGAGAFYAMQTLRQWMELDALKQADRVAVPCGHIEDAPRFRWRGFMLDEARHFWGMEKVKQTLDWMSFYKMNVFHWHLTEDQGWRIEIKKYPLLTEKGSIRKSTALDSKGYNKKQETHDNKEYGRGCFYTQEQAKEIVAYAAKLHIQIEPEVDMPGHLVSAMACYPELSCRGEAMEVSDRWGVMDIIGCCGKEPIYRFAKDVIDELCEIFPFPYFHIGGDEVPKTQWKKCPDCQKKIKELGLKNENELQGHFNNEILAHLRSKGKNMVGWNEILEASTLDPGTIVQWWVDEPARREQAWIREGGKVILSKHNHVYMDYPYTLTTVKGIYNYGPKVMGVPPEQEKNVIGIEAPLWTEYIRDTEKFDVYTYPRLQALAETGWTAEERKDYASFDQRLNYHCQLMKQAKIHYARRGLYDLFGMKKWLYTIRGPKNWQNDSYRDVRRNRELEAAEEK